MTHILVDWENIVSINAFNVVFKGINYLDEEDEIYFFYSCHCPRLKREYYNAILNSGSKIKFCRLQNTGKNALDFYIVTEVGRLVERGEKEIAILSGDNGYKAVKDYLDCNLEIEGVHLVLADTLTKIYSGFKSKRNKKRSKILHANEEYIELDTLLQAQNDLILQEKKDEKEPCVDDEIEKESETPQEVVAKIEEKSETPQKVVADIEETETPQKVVDSTDSVESLDKKIQDVIKDTELADIHKEILDFACRDFANIIELYQVAIHDFGRKTGTPIARVLSLILF